MGDVMKRKMAGIQRVPLMGVSVLPRTQVMVEEAIISWTNQKTTLQQSRSKQVQGKPHHQENFDDKGRPQAHGISQPLKM